MRRNNDPGEKGVSFFLQLGNSIVDFFVVIGDELNRRAPVASQREGNSNGQKSFPRANPVNIHASSWYE